MAYTDMDRSTINPKGMATAILINGGGVLAALFLGSTAYDVIKDKPIGGIDVNIDPPIPIEKPIEQKPTKDQAKGQSQERKVAAPDASKGSTPSTGLSVDAGGSSEETIFTPIEPKIEPIEITPPVVVGAKPDPRYVSAMQPDYPGSMIRAEMEGQVVIRVKIGTDGRVKEAIIVSATTDDFAVATKKQALSKWRFKPGTRDGVAEESWRTMTVTFEMPK